MSDVKLIRCGCNNEFDVSKPYCPFCHRFNAAVSSKQCPTCGQTLPEVIQV